MKKITILLLLFVFIFAGCRETTSPNDTSITQDSDSSKKIDNSIWYSEENDVQGRIWIGMTEKEVYDVLNKYNITISQPFHDNLDLEYDEYGAECLPSECYYNKRLYTAGHQSFFFDNEDELVEICYFDQMHYTSPPVNDEFEAQRGVKRRGKYEDMINAYGEPDKVINIDDSNETHVYYLENGDYLHFVYQGTSTPIQSIHYCKYPYLFSY